MPTEPKHVKATMIAALSVGDRVELPQGGSGTVVGVIERGEYGAGLSRGAWNQLSQGVLVKPDCGPIVHFREPLIQLKRLPVGC